MAVAPAAVTDMSSKKKKKSIFGAIFHRKKNKKKEKKVCINRLTYTALSIYVLYIAFYYNSPVLKT